MEKFDFERSAQHYADIFRPYLASGFAPPHALAEIMSSDDQKFWANFWEASLYWHFNRQNHFSLDNSHVKKSGQNGPDFKLRHGNLNVWIEAIAPSPTGIPADWLVSPKLGEVARAKTKPHEAILLRWTSELKQKREAFERYQENGTIAEKDCTVIAISSSMLHDFAFEDRGASRLPTAVEAVLPFGPLAVWIDPSGQMRGEPERIPRFSIENRNNAAIPTDNFLSRGYDNVSALMGSHKKDLLTDLAIVAIHNPHARNPLPTGILGASEEYVVELGGDYFTLKRI